MGISIFKSVFYFRFIPASIHRILGWHQKVAKVFASGTDVENHVDPDITWIFCLADSKNLAGHVLEDENMVAHFQSGMGQVMNESFKTS
jgi:hypothetical protein